MPTTKHNNEFYNKREDRIIYVLLSSDKKSFYINQCVKNSFRETYRHNLKGRRLSSKNFINELNSSRPCMFTLEELPNTTKHEANNYLVVWLKVFIENNFISFNNQKYIDFTHQLYFQNKQLYEKRKNVNLDLITSCKNCLIPIYKKQICEKYKALSQERGSKK